MYQKVTMIHDQDVPYLEQSHHPIACPWTRETSGGSANHQLELKTMALGIPSNLPKEHQITIKT